MAGQQFTPPSVLAEGAERTMGRNAQRMNIMAARIVAETVRSTLGPLGMDKMLVDSLGDVVVTNDGATIMREMDIKHPIAKMMIEVARAQEASVGDGTTTAVVIAGELLKKAETLIEMGIHPVVIVRGYRQAAEKCQKVLDKIAIDLPDNDQSLKAVALTTMMGKGVGPAREHLSDIVVKAVKSVASTVNDGLIDTDYIKLEKKAGAGIEETEFINGLVLDKEKGHEAMPVRVENARIALVSSPLEFQGKEIEAQIRITDPHQLQSFIDEQKRVLREMAEKVKSSGATVLFAEKSIHNLCLYYLAQDGIFTVRRVGRSDMEKLAKATGASVVANLDELRETALGYAGLIEEENVSGTKMIYVRQCREPKAVTILIRGGTMHILDEVERVIEDCLGTVPAAMIDHKILVGGGATEIELAKELKIFAKSVGKEQLAIEAFADALEIIPKSLAENAGLSQIDILVEMRKWNEKEGHRIGLDVFSGKVGDLYSEGIIEPLRVKKKAISSASEVAAMILRIDDVIAATQLKLPTPDEMASQMATKGRMPGVQ
ncbi:MAG: TCP-1/cpn60 chaperonin family protein [Nitrospirae bacterium]|nr:TCP-1/cpn60 chaperonin family protein [Nitrospirota bacterium]